MGEDTRGRRSVREDTRSEAACDKALAIRGWNEDTHGLRKEVHRGSPIGEFIVSFIVVPKGASRQVP